MIGEGRIPRTVPVAFSSYAGMDISRDNGLVVDLDYEDRAPYAFTGTVRNVVFDLKPAPIDEQSGLHAQQHRPAWRTGPPAEGPCARGRGDGGWSRTTLS